MSAPESGHDISQRRRKVECENKILQVLALKGPMSKYRIQKETELYYASVLRHVSRLVKDGIIKKTVSEKRHAEICGLTHAGVLACQVRGIISTPEVAVSLLRDSDIGKMLRKDTILVNELAKLLVEREYRSLERVASLLPPEVASAENIAPDVEWAGFAYSGYQRRLVMDAISSWPDLLKDKTSKQKLAKVLSSEENYKFLKEWADRAINFYRHFEKEFKNRGKKSDEFLKVIEEIKNPSKKKKSTRKKRVRV